MSRADPTRPAAVLLAVLALTAVPGAAQHAGHVHPPSEAPLERPGESISAALGEVLAALEADPATDWERVDLDALARHLQQMDALFSRARVDRRPVPDGVRFTVRGDADVLDAARAMVPAHARMTGGETGWTAEVEDLGEALAVTLRGEGEEDARRIRAVGFFGWMASGDHHRRHHWMMATGSGHP